MIKLYGCPLAPQQLPRLLINDDQALPHPLTAKLYGLVPEAEDLHIHQQYNNLLHVVSLPSHVAHKDAKAEAGCHHDDHYVVDNLYHGEVGQGTSGVVGKSRLLDIALDSLSIWPRGGVKTNITRVIVIRCVPVLGTDDGQVQAGVGAAALGFLINTLL